MNKDQERFRNGCLIVIVMLALTGVAYVVLGGIGLFRGKPEKDQGDD